MEPVLGQGWTLNYEMFCYALFAIALTLPRRIGLSALFLMFIGILASGTLVKSLSDVAPATTISSGWSSAPPGSSCATFDEISAPLVRISLSRQQRE
jgi:peptidoglycan/LPS O-acetylase OafA/YrhL